MKTIFAELMPHRGCFMSEQWAVPYYLSSNLIIGLVYVILSLGLTLLFFKSGNRIFKLYLSLFGSFILSCGIGHFLMVWNLYHGMYVMESMWSVFTAIVSAVTCFIVVLALLPLLQMSSRNFDTLTEKVANE